MLERELSPKEIVESLIIRSRKAQKIIDTYTQERVDKLAAAIGYKISLPEVAQEIAELAYQETGMGTIDSKYAKLSKKIPGCFYDVINQKTVGVIEENSENGITIIAKPVGIIGALIPSTNPEATPVFKGMLAIRGRNSVVFGPHPASKRTTQKVVEVMREVMENNGAPADAFICLEAPSKELSKEIMKQCDLIMATGSQDMVHAAYSSGKPSYGVGVGNAVIVVDETVDLPSTASMIKSGKIGDNASGCSAENSLVIQQAIYEKLLKELKDIGGYLCSPEEKIKLQKTMWDNGNLRREIIARDVSIIAKLAGIKVPENICFIMVEEHEVGPKAPFSGEKVSLVLTLYKYKEFQEAIDLVQRITSYSGLGHSCGIHTNDKERILNLALNTKTSRVTVRQPHGLANSGNWSNGLAFTFSLGCGTWGGNTASENISQKHYINTTRISEPINRKELSREEIFNDYIEGMVIKNDGEK